MGVWEFSSLGAVVLAVDQGTKTLVLRRVGQRSGATSRRLLRPAVSRGWLLTGAPSAGLFAAVWTLSAAAVLALTGTPAFGLGPAACVALMVALGGSAGNLLDRFRRGGVVDFIAIGRWPAFNIADVAIVVGAAIAVGTVLWR